MVVSEVTVTASVAGGLGNAGWTTAVADPQKLAAMSWWFRQMIEGPYREAREGVIRVEVEDEDELGWLRQLVDGRFDDNDDDDNIDYDDHQIQQYPNALTELMRLYLVAHKYCFEEVVTSCRAGIVGILGADAKSLDEVVDVLAVAPEALYMDPEIERVLRKAAKRICEVWCHHENHMLAAYGKPWTDERLTHASVAHLLVPIPEFLCLPPHALALVIKVRHSSTFYNPRMDSGLYRLIQGYVESSPSCGGGDRADDAAVLYAYRVLVEALLGPKCMLGRDLVCFVVSACPYAQRSGMLPRIVSAGLAVRLCPSMEPYRFQTRIRIGFEYIRHFKPGDRFHFQLGMQEGMHLFLCLTRASFPASHDVFALTLLALCPGQSPRQDGPFITDKIYEVEGSFYNEERGHCEKSALVCFEGEEAPAVRTLALLQEVMVNEGVGLPRRLAWAEAVQEGSPYFDDQGFLDIDLWVE